ALEIAAAGRLDLGHQCGSKHESSPRDRKMPEGGHSGLSLPMGEGQGEGSGEPRRRPKCLLASATSAGLRPVARRGLLSALEGGYRERYASSRAVSPIAQW